MANNNLSFLPTSKEEMDHLGWEEADIIIFTGDAYVDHPAFGAAIIGRYLESKGYRVAIVPQPNWRDDLRDFRKLGRPRLFFGVTAGNMDSMVNHYTATKRLRSDDAYSPGGKAGFRPDYPSIVYTRAIRQCFPDVPVILGGIEASLRRLTHYDYWQNNIKPSILVESGADLLVYGMGEQAVESIADKLKMNVPLKSIRDIPQTVFLSDTVPPDIPEILMLPSYEDCCSDRKKFAKAFTLLEQESNRMFPRPMAEKSGNKYVVVNPPFHLETEKEIDRYYDLPYVRQPHPRYHKRGMIPAFEMIRHSVTLHRGCFGGCSFCTISAHQGKFISSRSEASVLRELSLISNMPGFRGTITDLGGPSANMYRMSGFDKTICVTCKRPSCIFPSICKNLNTSHLPLIKLYDKALAVKGVKKVFIGSGVRYDLFVQRPESVSKRDHLNEYCHKLISRHVSGRLKVAPEHTSEKVLKVMRKPSFRLFYALKEKFDTMNRQIGKKQQLIPYFISSHPACTLDDMKQLAGETRKLGFRLEQVQDLTPTPMTLASVMYYTGLDPYTMKPLYVARTRKEKEAQRDCFFWYKPLHAEGSRNRRK
ncbi:MAG TPA: YgiQ family radical SAM protein [Bacteroidales bacterium]|nr:YgiQ family radical SAM protein [Bacteroidales bacterium]HSA42972.1 YgiQ family radical SAM protein [Bacteroidales bacterium]